MLLSSCNHTNNEYPIVNSGYDANCPNMTFLVDTSLSVKVDESFSLLGCGFDCKVSPIKGNFNVKKTVIDVSQLVKGNGYDYMRKLIVKFPLSEVNKSILYQSGYNISNVCQSIDQFREKLYLSTKAENYINDIQLNIFTIIADNFDDIHFGDAYFLFEYYKPTSKLTLPEINPKYLCYFLTQDFIKDLYSKSPDEIIEIYGTHVLTDILLGGWISISSIVNFSSNTNIGAVKDMNLYYSHFLNSSFSDNGQRYFEGFDNIAFYIYATGGECRNIQICNNQILGFQNWFHSICDDNEQIIGIGNNTNQIFLLSDFIMDIEKKREIEEAIIRYCNKSIN